MVALSVKTTVCGSRGSHTSDSTVIKNTYTHKIENNILSLLADVTHNKFQINCKNAR
jgi:hypothetical protein